MERIRVEIRKTSGSSYYVSPAKAADMILKKQATWLDDAHRCALSAAPSTERDMSGVMGSRAIWRIVPSDGFSVMQLT